jgi:hypothetical protein
MNVRNTMVDTTVDVGGRPVAFRMNDIGRPGARDTQEAAVVVVNAVLQALHLPVTSVLKAVVATVTRTALEIVVETSVMVQDARVTMRRDKFCVTASRISDYLVGLSHDSAMDPEVKRMLRDALIEDLKCELTRLSRTGGASW